MRTSSLMMTVLATALLPLAAYAGSGTPTAKLRAPYDNSVPNYVTAAIHDPARKADRANDARRKMAAVMTFTGVEPGDTVVELVPGSGYWTRVFSQIVGPNGHVYQVWPKQMMKYYGKDMKKWQKLAKSSHYANVSVLAEPAQNVTAPGKADIVFTANNYHDYHNIPGIDIEKFDQSVFNELKPGGVFIVIDHAAPAGSGTKDTDTLHRIDPMTAIKEIQQVGFKFAGFSNALYNPSDPLDISDFNKAIRGYTSQFIFRFRKPKSGSSTAHKGM